ncbi:MAG: esterase/lipase family protein [Nodosilinea sp.]
MPLAERANNVLEIFANKRIGQRPVVFITHSMGGLLVKQLLRNATDFGSGRQRQVAEQTKGLIFVATPHSGSNWSNWAQFINGLLLNLPKISLSVEELEHGHSRLQELNYVYRGHPQLGQIPVKAYYETRPLKSIGVVVDRVSADLGKPEAPTPVDADHISICKISRQDREDGVVYGSILLFLEDFLSETHPQPTEATQPREMPLDRGSLFKQLAGLPPPQFGLVVFTLNPPPGTVPDGMAAQGARVEALLNWAEGTGGCGLAEVNAVLQKILNRPR